MKAHEFKHEMRGTSAVFGRSHGVSVVFEGDTAKTNGHEIVLPAMPDEANLTGEQVRMMRGYVDHEAGHLRHSDMPLIHDKYDRWTNSGQETLKKIHNCLEDIWMEDRVMKEYVGSEKNLHTTSEVISRREHKLFSEAPEGVIDEVMSSFNETSITSAISKIGRQDYTGTDCQKFIDDYLPEKLQEHAKNWTQLVKECKNTEEVMQLARSVNKLIEQDPEMQSNPEDFDPDSGDESEDGEHSPEYKEYQEGSGMPDPNGEPQEGEGEPQEGEGPSLDSDPQDALEDEIEKGIPGGKGHPNGDFKGSYTVSTTKNDKYYTMRDEKLHDMFKTSRGVSTFEQQKSNISGTISTMKSKLRRALLAKEQRDWDGGKEMGRLDTKRLVAGYQLNPQVFKVRKDRQGEDTAIYILVDQSGSMGGRKIKVAQQCVIALSECFEGTQMKYQIVGFDNHGEMYRPDGRKYHRYTPNNMYEFKPFDTPLRKCRAPIGYMPKVGMCNNSDRDALMYAINDLRLRPESRKILFVLSDGCPAHSSDSNMKELTKHARLAVEGAKAYGIECIGIGIQDSTVKKIYKDNVVIDSVSELSGVSFSKFTKLLLKGG